MAVKERRGLTRKGDHAFLAERIKKNFRLFRKILKKFFLKGKRVYWLSTTKTPDVDGCDV